MKKILLVMITTGVLLLGFVACGVPQTVTIQTEQPSSTALEAAELTTFKGVISSIDENRAIVVPNKDETIILSSGDQVYVAIPHTLDVKVGDEVTVEYDGDIMESYPLQVNTISVNGIKIEQESLDAEDVSDDSVHASDTQSDEDIADVQDNDNISPEPTNKVAPSCADIIHDSVSVNDIDCDSDFWDDFEVIPAGEEDSGVVFDMVIPDDDLQCIKLPVLNGYIDLAGTWKYILMTQEGYDSPEDDNEYDYVAEGMIRTITFNPDGTSQQQDTPELGPESFEWQYVVRDGEIEGIHYYFEGSGGWIAYPLEAREENTVVLQLIDKTDGDSQNGESFIRTITLEVDDR